MRFKLTECVWNTQSIQTTAGRPASRAAEWGTTGAPAGWCTAVSRTGISRASSRSRARRSTAVNTWLRTVRVCKICTILYMNTNKSQSSDLRATCVDSILIILIILGDQINVPRDQRPPRRQQMPEWGGRQVRPPARTARRALAWCRSWECRWKTRCAC